MDMSSDINATEETAKAPEAAAAGGTSESLDQVKQIASQVFGVLGDAPDYVVSIFGEYKRPITVIGLVLGSLVLLKLTFAILDAINDIPVLSPTFELIGIVYSGWFVYRYLIKAEKRTELVATLNSAKDQIIGRNA
ncbi:MAG: CAAD domain-containing protein [Cyanobacteria bacterium P01_A01_bin.105]